MIAFILPKEYTMCSDRNVMVKSLKPGEYMRKIIVSQRLGRLGRKNPSTSNSRFSHDVTKIQTRELSILPNFYVSTFIRYYSS